MLQQMHPVCFPSFLQVLPGGSGLVFSFFLSYNAPKDLTVHCIRKGTFIMGQKSVHDLDMTHGNIFTKMFVFAVPLALSGMLQLFFNAADVVVLGRYVGSEALAGVGSTTSLINLLVNFFMGLGVGVNVVVSTNYAAGKTEEVSKTVHTSIAVALVSGIFLVIVGNLVSAPMLTFMDTPDNVFDYALTYIRIYFCAVPAILVYNFGAAILRSIGDTKRPFYYLLAAGIINVLLNLFFVLVLNLGVMGVALATGISNVISAGLVIYALMKESSCLKLSFQKLNLDIAVIRKIASVGLPAGIQSIFFNISNVLIQSSVNSFGSVVMAGNAAAINVDGFYSTAYSSITSASITFISANLGAKKYSRLNKVLWCSLLASFLICAMGSSLYTIFGRSFLSLFTTDPEVIDWGMVRVSIFNFGMFFAAWMDDMTAILRGLGNGILPMFFTLLGAVGFRLFWIYCVFPYHRTYAFLIWGYPISWALTFTALLICYYFVRRKYPKEDAPEEIQAADL